MTLFLASVASIDEAETALVGGADIIDAKDPTTGALGALAPEAVRSIVAAVAGRRPVSAVAGNLPMEPTTVLAAARALAAAGVAYLKIGFPAGAQREACIWTLAALASEIKLVGVMFADAGFDPALVPLMAQSGFAGAMIDTARKAEGSLLGHLDLVALRAFVEACHAHGLRAGLAGSLELPDIPRLLPLAPDILGFRGALCGTGRRSDNLDPPSVARVRALIPTERDRSQAGAGTAKVDYRLLAARCWSSDPSGNGATDRIFVHDFVLAAHIGAYARERDRTQSVRFNVDMDVRRGDRVAEDMRDIFSYDVVTDGIRMIVASEHIDLVETLAERVAALVLAHGRVVRVTVKVEKLEVGPGSVGVEITRERAVEVGGVHQLFAGVEPAAPKRAP